MRMPSKIAWSTDLELALSSLEFEKNFISTDSLLLPVCDREGRNILNELNELNSYARIDWAAFDIVKNGLP